VDLDTLKKFSAGTLPPKQFMAVHRDAEELMEIFDTHLHPGEFVSSLADWPAVRKKPRRQFVVLKTMMLLTPLVLVGSTAFIFSSPILTLNLALIWLAAFAVIAGFQLFHRNRTSKSTEGKSVVAVTNRRIMRIWLDGTGEVQFWPLGDDESKPEPVEPVPETVRLLLQLDLGKTSLN
jgi:hypothetical protein